MKKKNWLPRVLCTAMVTVLLSAFVVLAANVGTSTDPLVTLSYLNDTYLGQILSQVDSKLTQRDAALQAQLNTQVQQAEQKLASQYAGGSTSDNTASTYAVVTLEKGQILLGTVGTEVMLRVGTAKCLEVPAPGLIDTTDGSALNEGKLKVNHLYMATVEGRGLQATSDTVKVLVRGSYVIQ